MDARNCDLIWTGSGWRLPDEATRNALVVASKNDEDTMFKCLQLPYWDLLIEIAQIYPCSPFLKAHFPPVTRDAASWVCQQFKNGNAPPIDTLCFVLNILTEYLKNLAFFNSFVEDEFNIICQYLEHLEHMFP
jgi:hypothetical protein